MGRIFIYEFKSLRLSTNLMLPKDFSTKKRRLKIVLVKVPPSCRANVRLPCHKALRSRLKILVPGDEVSSEEVEKRISGNLE